MSKQKTALAGSSGVLGGYTIVPEPTAPTKPQTGETQPAGDPKAQLKEAISGAVQPHLGSGEDDLATGHKIHMHPETGAVHHSHPADYDPEKLAQIKGALEQTPGVSSVTQEAEKSTPPADGGWEHAYGTKGADEMGDEMGDEQTDDNQPAPAKPAQQAEADPEETKRLLATVKQMPQQALGFYLKLQQAVASAALKACVQKKRAQLAKQYPELSKDQHESMAYGMCDGKACKDLNDAAPGGLNPDEDGADENLPHGVQHAKATLAHHVKGMPQMHPADKEFYKATCGLVKEHAESEYPEHADHFKDFDGDGDGDAADTKGQQTGKADGAPQFGEEHEQDEEDGAAKTQAAVAPYKAYKFIALKRLERKLGSQALSLFAAGSEQFKELASLKPGDKWTAAQKNAVAGLARQFKSALATWGAGVKLDTPAASATSDTETVIKNLGSVLSEAVKEMVYPLTGKQEHKPANVFRSAKQ